MGLTDILFGRKKLKGPAEERLFALCTAAVTLQTELNLTTAGVAAVVFKPLSAGEFVRVENEMEELVQAVAQSSGAKLDRKEDSFGFEWLIVRDPDLEDQVTAVHAVASELQSRGFGDRLLAAAFKFGGSGAKRPVYWIYGYKTGTFWPFVPTGQGQERDNAEELELKAKLEGELPVEQDLSRWLGLFDAPL
jgi:PspAB-like protein